MWVDVKQFFFGRKTSDNSPQVATFTDDGKLRTDTTVGDVQVNLPDTYPLPQAQIDELRNVTVQATIGEVEIKNDVGNPVPVRTGADLHPLGDQLADAQIGMVTQTVIHGVTTGQGGGYRDVKVTPSGALTVEATVTGVVSIEGTVNIAEPVTVDGTVNVGNTVAVSATDLDIRNLSSAQDSVTVTGTVTANLGTLNGAATSANQTTTNTTLASLDNKTPDESGTWGYNAGTSGTLTVAANKRILAITATAGALTAASMTINGGQTITIPAGTSITITPRANLTAPTLVFTSTASYFVEFIE